MCASGFQLVRCCALLSDVPWLFGTYADEVVREINAKVLGRGLNLKE